MNIESQTPPEGNPPTAPKARKPSARSAADFPVVEEAYQFLMWLTQAVEKLPRASKFTLGDRLEGKGLELLDHLVTAVYTRDRAEVLKQANLAIEQMRFLIRLCADRRLIGLCSYEHASRSLDAIGRGVGGWIKASHAQASRRPLPADRIVSGVADSRAARPPRQEA